MAIDTTNYPPTIEQIWELYNYNVEKRTSDYVTATDWNLFLKLALDRINALSWINLNNIQNWIALKSEQQTYIYQAVGRLTIWYFNATNLNIVNSISVTQGQTSVSQSVPSIVEPRVLYDVIALLIKAKVYAEASGIDIRDNKSEHLNPNEASGIFQWPPAGSGLLTRSEAYSAFIEGYTGIISENNSIDVKTIKSYGGKPVFNLTANTNIDNKTITYNADNKLQAIALYNAKNTTYYTIVKIIEDITTNHTATVNNQKRIENVANQLTTLTDQVGINKLAINKNTTHANSNTNAIAANKKSSDDNTKNITANKESIDVLTTALQKRLTPDNVQAGKGIDITRTPNTVTIATAAVAPHISSRSFQVGNTGTFLNGTYILNNDDLTFLNQNGMLSGVGWFKAYNGIISFDFGVKSSGWNNFINSFNDTNLQFITFRIGKSYLQDNGSNRIILFIRWTPDGRSILNIKFEEAVAIQSPITLHMNINLNDPYVPPTN